MSSGILGQTIKYDIIKADRVCQIIRKWNSSEVLMEAVNALATIRFSSHL